MFCHNCGFEIKDQDLTECPECSCILSQDLLSDNEYKETEEFFEDIENILNSDELDNDITSEDTDISLPEEISLTSPEDKLEALEENNGTQDDFEDEGAFDFEAQEQDKDETAEEHIDEIIEEDIIEEPETGLENTIDDLIPEQENIEESAELEDEDPAAVLETDNYSEKEDESETEDEGPVTVLETDDYIAEEEEEPEPSEENIPEEVEQELPEEKSINETEEIDDETEEASGAQKSSKATPVLLFLFFLIIAAGAGVFYLKTQQLPSPPVPKIKASNKEDKILKSILKKEKKQLTVKTEPVKTPPQKPVLKKPPKKPEASTPAKEPVLKKEEIVVKKKTEPQKKKPEVKIEAKKQKSSSIDNFWIRYIPGKQTYYAIQISSMANRSYAKSTLSRLKRNGYPAYIILTKNKEGLFLYKLRIGKYKTEIKAKKAADNFYKKEKMKYIIVPSNADMVL